MHNLHRFEQLQHFDRCRECGERAAELCGDCLRCSECCDCDPDEYAVDDDVDDYLPPMEIN